MMDFDARILGMDNYTTANDVARLLELLNSGELISKIYSAMMLDIMKMQLDNSMMNNYLPQELVVAHKTGTFQK